MSETIIDQINAVTNENQAVTINTDQQTKAQTEILNQENSALPVKEDHGEDANQKNKVYSEEKRNSDKVEHHQNNPHCKANEINRKEQIEVHRVKKIGQQNRIVKIQSKKIEKNTEVSSQNKEGQPKKPEQKMSEQQKSPQQEEMDDKWRREHEERLQRLIKQREDVESALKNLEDEIYNFEEKFLEETAEFGSVIRGLNHEALLSQEPPNPQAPKWSLNDIRFRDRVFSNTSVKSPATRAHPRPKQLTKCPASSQPSTSKAAFNTTSKEDLPKKTLKKSTAADMTIKVTKTKKRKVD